MRDVPLAAPAPKHEGPAPDALTSSQVERGDGNVSQFLHLEVLRLEPRAGPALTERS
jgi:hypothetical protein